MAQIIVLEAGHRAAAVALWKECGLTVPWNDPELDFNRALETQTASIFGMIDEGVLIATIMAGYEGHRGWLYYLAVADGARRQGTAKTLIAHAEAWLRSLGAPKIMLMVRKGNTGAETLYESLGYEVSDVTTYGKFF